MGNSQIAKEIEGSKTFIEILEKTYNFIVSPPEGFLALLTSLASLIGALALLIAALAFCFIIFGRMFFSHMRNANFKISTDGFSIENVGKNISDLNQEQFTPPQDQEKQPQTEDAENLNKSTFKDFLLAIFRDEDFKKAESIILELIEKGEIDKESGITLLYSDGHEKSLVDGIAEIKKLEGENLTWIQPSKYLAEHYIECNMLEEAAKHVKNILDRAIKSDDIIDGTIKQSKILLLKNKKDDAVDLLLSKLGSFRSQEDETIYLALADLFNREKDWEAEAYYLEAALKLAPDNSTVRFRLGYLYAENNKDYHAFHHYSILLKQRKKQHSAANNYGILIGKHGALGKKISHMRDALNQGETYPAANMANALIGQGFYLEAEKIIQEIPTLQQDEKIILDAKTLIKEKKEQEEKIENDLRNNAEKLYQIITQQTEHETNRNSFATDSAAKFSGKWLFLGKEIEIEEHNSNIRGFYNTDTEKYTVEGRKIGASILLNFTQTEFYAPHKGLFLSSFLGFGKGPSAEPVWQTSTLIGSKRFQLNLSIKNYNELEGFKMEHVNTPEKVHLTKSH